MAVLMVVFEIFINGTNAGEDILGSLHFFVWWWCRKRKACDIFNVHGFHLQHYVLDRTVRLSLAEQTL